MQNYLSLRTETVSRHWILSRIQTIHKINLKNKRRYSKTSVFQSYISFKFYFFSPWFWVAGIQGLKQNPPPAGAQRQGVGWTAERLRCKSVLRLGILVCQAASQFAVSNIGPWGGVLFKANNMTNMTQRGLQ